MYIYIYIWRGIFQFRTQYIYIYIYMCANRYRRIGDTVGDIMMVN